MIEVTAAIIHKNEKLLICQRPAEKRCGRLWEFPGGKIETGETPAVCLARECQEELGITVEIDQLVRKVGYEYPDITVNIHFYMCTIINGEPNCIEHSNIQWLTLDEILKLPLCPADSKLLHLAENDIRKSIQTT